MNRGRRHLLRQYQLALRVALDVVLVAEVVHPALLRPTRFRVLVALLVGLALLAHDFDARGFLPSGAVQNAEKAIRELGERNEQYPAEKFLAALRVIEEWNGRGKAKMFDELLRRALVRANPLLAAPTTRRTRRDASTCRTCTWART